MNVVTPKPFGRERIRWLLSLGWPTCADVTNKHRVMTTTYLRAGFRVQEVRHLLKRLVERCEWYLHRYIHRVMQCPQWTQLPSAVQQELLQSE